MGGYGTSYKLYGVHEKLVGLNNHKIDGVCVYEDAALETFIKAK
jgi:hypothetical protein